MSRIYCIAILTLFVNGTLLAGVEPTAEEKAVFAGEEAYWRYRNEGNKDAFLALFHDDFLGWPCGAPRTSDRSVLVRFVDEWFADAVARRMHATFEPEGIVLDDAFAVTYLAATLRWEVNGEESRKGEKIVHTWKRTADGWKIIGGMCGPLEQGR